MPLRRLNNWPFAMNETHASSPKADPFSATQAVAAGIDFAELQAGPLGLFWNEYRPEDGACRIWLWQDAKAQCLTPDGFSARSRVYEYGGGSFCLRSEEHTSELQSLMRISYAVFGFKKKTQNTEKTGLRQPNDTTVHDR